MKKVLVLTAAILTFALVAAATDVPREEAFLGYNFVRFNPDSSFIPSFNANGGSGQFVYNFNKWIGAAVDLGAVTKGTLNQTNVDTTVVDFVAGPRVTFHNHSRFQPFVQALFGGAYATTSMQVIDAVTPPGAILPPGLPVTARLVASKTGFAMLVGGGLDIKMSKHIAFRPIGADYYLTRMPNLLTGNDRNANNFRYSAGVNFLFGAQ
jgi:opacity protein-like surface antigen